MDESEQRFLLQLQRQYYFNEAMAFYEAYYDPVKERVTESASAVLRDALASSPMTEDRPLTWVPIVWHATTFKAFEGMVESEHIRSPMHLTELSIGEIDRIRIRKPSRQQVAIGFARRFVQNKGLTPVLYLKHNPLLAELLKKSPEASRALAPFLEPNDDTGSFQELRTTQELPIKDAIWILTTANKDAGGTERPWVPGLEAFQRKWGRIPICHWERIDPHALLKGWHYLYTICTPTGRIDDAVTFGE